LQCKRGGRSPVSIPFRCRKIRWGGRATSRRVANRPRWIGHRSPFGDARPHANAGHGFRSCTKCSYSLTVIAWRTGSVSLNFNRRRGDSPAARYTLLAGFAGATARDPRVADASRLLWRCVLRRARRNGPAWHTPAASRQPQTGGCVRQPPLLSTCDWPAVRPARQRLQQCR
jgi:hypothetical protein